MKQKIMYLVIGILVLCVGYLLIIKLNKARPAGTYYFQSYGTYSDPKALVTEITFEEAQENARNGYAYYEAIFDDHGELIVVKKYYRGKEEIKYQK